MGSYCAITFDQMEIATSKSAIPDEFAALFQEADRDRRLQPGDDPEEANYRYTAARLRLLQRLSLLGATSEAAAQAFDRWRSKELETWGEYAEERWGQDELQALQTLTLDEWFRRIPYVLATRYDAGDYEPTDLIDRKLRDLDDEWVWFDGHFSLLNMRCLLDACPDVGEVSLDVSELVANGYYTTDRPLETEARRSVFEAYNPLTPTLVLAEGSSDIAILRRGLEIFYPELLDYFSFFNHAELKVDGGANYLVKFLKAFAGANMTMRMLAIFDNDVAGRQALKAASALSLPPNILVTHLPECEIARAFPTVGPQGEHVMDVNGLAAGIEIYLGEDALTVAGKLSPVRWTGYVATADAYQGEVDGKSEVTQRFYALSAEVRDRDTARRAFPDLERIWEHIIDVVESAAEGATLRKWAKLQRDY